MKAFPSPHWKQPEYEGMDLRDYFAAKAMQGLLSTTKEETWIPNDVAEISYLVADAMIKAREEK